EWATEPIDLSGSAEQVWASVSTVYNLMPLDPAVVKSLEKEFLTQAAGLADADGRVPSAQNVHVVTTTLAN
ncbi:class I SAM-dependent methyltransferase, partial [Amycolatopsis sp. NPDC023774]